MHRRAVVRVAKIETLKALPLREVKALAISLDMNRPLEISLMLRRYRGDIASISLAQPHD
jgi:hypothetical protein